ncbi:MAG: hypothetical protein R3C26_19950 [Calditrichia bacterium]
MESTSKTISDALNALHSQLEAVDPTLVNSLEKTRDSMKAISKNSAEKLCDRWNSATKRWFASSKKSSSICCPAVIIRSACSMLYFIVKYGPDFVENLLENLPEDPSPHYIVKL